jgi:hypothetical protein
MYQSNQARIKKENPSVKGVKPPTSRTVATQLVAVLFGEVTPLNRRLNREREIKDIILA